MPRRPQPVPDRDADPEAWERWNERQYRNRLARERRAMRRDRLAYPTDGTPLVAEASCEGTFFRPSPLPPSLLRVSVRIQAPEEDFPQDGSMTFSDSFLSDALPFPWRVRDFIWSMMKNAVHIGMDVYHPLPRGGLDVSITRLDVVPPLLLDSTSDEIGRFGDALVGVIQGAVSAALRGLIAYNQQSRYVARPPMDPEWKIGVCTDAGVEFTDAAFPTRQMAEAAITPDQRAKGYRAFEIRDMIALEDLRRGQPPSGEIRYGDRALTSEESTQVQPDMWIFHLGRRRLVRVRGVKLDAPRGPLINAGRGWEHYTFFRLPREGDRG